MSERKKKVLLTLSVLAGIAILVVMTAAGFLIAGAAINGRYRFSHGVPGGAGDRIHFLNVGHSDAILLESAGRFALIDSGEDSDNPRGLEDLQLEGYEQNVVNYLKQHARGEDGKVHLSFVVGTHAHSDHIGGFDTVINDPDIVVERAYLKRYDPERIDPYERENWDNEEVYRQMLDACANRGVEVIQTIDDTPFSLGNLTITLFNGEEASPDATVGENENSLGVLVEGQGVRAFLAGDINDIDGDEARLKDVIGKVDLLKIGHHGYRESSSKPFLDALDPSVTIVTNRAAAVYFEARMRLLLSGSAVFGTVNREGIVVELKEGKMLMYDRTDLR